MATDGEANIHQQGRTIGELPGRMRVVAYLDNGDAAFYRLVLDVLLEEESRLGLHLPTAEIASRVLDKLAGHTQRDDLPPVERLLGNLHEWGNVDRIHNTHRKGSYQEYLKKDYLFQLTPAGAQVHRALTAIDQELGAAGALQSSMLPEVLSSLNLLVTQLGQAPDGHGRERARKTAVYGTVQRVFNGFTQLSENAKLFVQGLNRALEPGTDLDDEIFLAYKDVVVLYLRTFVMALLQYAAPITQAIEDAEAGGIVLLFPELARLEATPVLGMSIVEVVEQDTRLLDEQWRGLRSWFFGEHDRPPVAQTLQDRSAEAVNHIVAIVRRRNDRRFRKVNRAADLLTLATWFSGTSDPVDRAMMWRAAFGMYSARHIGAAHSRESDLDARPKTSWWDGPAAPVEPRLRKHGPKATTGRPAGVGDPKAAKRKLAARRAGEQAVVDAAVALFVRQSPVRMSALPCLADNELDLLLGCLNVVLAARPDAHGLRRGRTGDGRLDIVLRRGSSRRGATVRTQRGDLAMEDFELTVIDRSQGIR
ncbi:TIGR02677 family protein [Actinokineospora enzanensis]|uniref:TIGR02677 family protein n=1 Tax=Actinokineospora enzanensis TaxID=155975 RepID=UPI00039F71EA|nr:TIGR02677 family protein [Actinokineospora enzanensis]